MHTDKGNTTTYEWLYGEAPQNVEVTNDQFADDGGSGDAADEIDWDITVADENGGSYDISMDESGIVVESSGQPTNVATGNESYTILDNPKTRDEFINQLLEVSSNFASHFNFIQVDNKLDFNFVLLAAIILKNAIVGNTKRK